MSLIARWTWGKAARLVEEALVAARIPDGPVAVVDGSQLARLLAERGRTVLDVAADKKGAAPADELPAEPASLAAVVGSSGDDWEARLGRWLQLLEEGGAVVLVQRGHRHELSRRLLLLGLMEIEQRVSPRAVVTSGRLCRFDQKR